jgi:hypothetical protein
MIKKNGTQATWNDAMSHCTEEVKSAWTQSLTNMGIDPTSMDVRGIHE